MDRFLGLLRGTLAMFLALGQAFLLFVTGKNTAAALANANPIRYRGYYYDVETGYYFLQTRYYNPEWHRFLNADVMFIAGNDALNAANMYAYLLPKTLAFLPSLC